MATVGPTNLPAYFNADSDFRTWGSTISAALATLGLVQTADTGQINWTTVTKPAATNTSQGYEIWKFNDTLQGTAPIFIKVQYGSAGAIDRPSLWMQVGSGSNGSGGLTGQASSLQQVNTTSSKSAGVTLPFYASGSAGELILAVNLDSGNGAFGFMCAVERPKDGTDTATSDGAVFYYMCNQGGFYTQFIPAAGSIPSAANANWPTVWPNAWSRSASGANVDIAPVFIPLGGAWRYSHVNVHKPGDLAFGGSYSATMLGGSHTYMSIDTGCGTGPTAVAGVNPGISFRWE